jgi:hypothetical protein
LPNVPYSFTAIVNPITTSLPLSYTWTVSDQTGITVTGGISDSETFTWGATGLKQIVLQASNISGSALVTHTIDIDYIHNYLPFIIRGSTTSAIGHPAESDAARLLPLQPHR